MSSTVLVDLLSLLVDHLAKFVASASGDYVSQLLVITQRHISSTKSAEYFSVNCRIHLIFFLTLITVTPCEVTVHNSCLYSRTVMPRNHSALHVYSFFLLS